MRPRKTWKLDELPNIRVIDEVDFSFEDRDLRHLAILVGAGISVKEPSRLPAAYQFLKTFYDVCLPASCDRNIFISNIGPYASLMPATADLRFETVLGILQNRFDSKLDILNIYRDAEPNLNHRALNALAQRGALIITTNFDTLVETAEGPLNFKIRATDQDFEDVNADHAAGPPVPEFWHLHGIIAEPWTKKDRSETIVASIRDCWRSKELFRLDRAKGQALHKALSERDLLVLGYSGSDDYDIAPALEEIYSNRRLIWVQHTPRYHGPVLPDGVSPLVRDFLPDGTSWYRAPCANSLATILANRNRLPEKVALLRHDTELLLLKLARISDEPELAGDRTRANESLSFFQRLHSWFGREISKKKTLARGDAVESKAKSAFFLKWRKSHLADEPSRYLLAIRLSEIGGLFEEAERLLYESSALIQRVLTSSKFEIEQLRSVIEISLRMAEQLQVDPALLLQRPEFLEFLEQQPPVKALFMTTAGRINAAVGRLDEAIFCFEESLRIRHAASFLQDLEVAEYDLARGLFSKGFESGDLDDAERQANKALKTALSVSHPEGIARGYLLLGRINEQLGSVGKATEYYQQACNAAFRTGDERLTAESFGEFGLFLLSKAANSVVERKKKIFEGIIDPFLKSPIMADNPRLIENMTSPLMQHVVNLQLRVTDADREDCEQAAIYLAEAFRIHDRQKDWPALKLIASNLAECLGMLGQGERSLLADCTVFRCAAFLEDEFSMNMSLERIRQGAQRELPELNTTQTNAEKFVTAVQKNLIAREIFI